MPRTRYIASRGGRLKLPSRRYRPKARPTRNVSVEKRTGGSHQLSPGQKGGRVGENLTFARLYIHSHIFKADILLIPFLDLSDSVIVAGRVPSSARPRFPKNQKEEEVTPVRRARLNGSVAE